MTKQALRSPAPAPSASDRRIWSGPTAPPWTPALLLQRSAGNHVVHALIHGPGAPLESGIRRELEPGLGADLSSVRVHTDEDTARAAAALGARAFTAGEDIGFAAGRYAPGTNAGRRLLAHELAHVLQQRTTAPIPGTVGGPGDTFERQADSVATAMTSGNGPSPVTPVGDAPAAVQCAPEEQATEPAASRGGDELDSAIATIYDVFYADPSSTSTVVVIAQAFQLFGDLHGKKLPGPKSQVAAARALLAIHRELERRVATSSRDKDGALLADQFPGPVPWAPNRPKNLDELRTEGGDPLFATANLQAWTAMIVSAPDEIALQKPRTSRREPPGKPAAGPTPAAQPEAKEGPAPVRAMTLGSELQEAPKVSTEEETPDVIGPEVAAGLKRLQDTTVRQALDAIRERLEAVATPGEQPAKLRPGANDKLSLLRASGRILFLGNRIYLLDRTGHLAPGEFAFHLKGISLKAGGTYFYGRFLLGTEGSSGAAQLPLLVRLDTSPPRAEGGDIYPRFVNTGLIPLLNELGAVIASGAGFGIVVSSKYGHGELGIRDLDFKKIRRAISGAQQHLGWAIRSRLRQAEENPAGELFSAALGWGISELAAILPPIRAPLAMYQALREVEWVGEHVNMAGYARTEDEVNFVSQSIARRLADEAVDRVIGGFVKAGAGRAKVAAAKARQAVRAKGAAAPQPPVAQGAPPEAATPEPPAAKPAPPSSSGAAAKPPETAAPDDRPGAKVYTFPKERTTPPKSPPAGVDDRPNAKVIPLPKRPPPKAPPPEAEEAAIPEAQKATGTGDVEGTRIPPREGAPPSPGSQQPPTVASAGGTGRPKLAVVPPPGRAAPAEKGGQRGTPSVTRRPPPKQVDAPSGPPPGFPREPTLSDPAGTLESRVDFLSQNDRHLGPKQRQWLADVKARVAKGQLSKNERAQLEQRIKPWEKTADTNLKARYADDLDNVVPFPVTGTQRTAKHAGGEWEQAQRSASGETNPKLSMTSQTAEGEPVQIDGYDPKRKVPREIKSHEEMKDMQTRDRELFEQMERHARFARDWELTLYEWVCFSEKVAQKLDLIRHDLPKELRDKIRIVNEGYHE